MPIVRVVVGDFNKMIQEMSTSKDTLTIEQMQASLQERLNALKSDHTLLWTIVQESLMNAAQAAEKLG